MPESLPMIDNWEHLYEGVAPEQQRGGQAAANLRFALIP